MPSGRWASSYVPRGQRHLQKKYWLKNYSSELAGGLLNGKQNINRERSGRVSCASTARVDGLRPWARILRRKDQEHNSGSGLPAIRGHACRTHRFCIMHHPGDCHHRHSARRATSFNEAIPKPFAVKRDCSRNRRHWRDPTPYHLTRQTIKNNNNSRTIVPNSASVLATSNHIGK